MRKSLRNLELDRLRAFAVVMTIFIHFSRVFFPWDTHQDYHNGGSILNLLENSWMGVDLFFVISGFIISKVIVDKIDSLNSKSLERAKFIKNFFIKRFFRIYPLAVTFFVFVFFCSIFFNKSGNFSTPENTLEAGVSIFTYTFNYYFGSGQYHAFTLSPYWSLSVEEQFYLIFPFFLVFIKSHKRRVLALISLLLVITFIIRPLSQDNIFYTQNRCDGLIYGCLLYYLASNATFKSLFKPFKSTPMSMRAIVLVLVFLLATVTSIGFSNSAIIPVGCIVSSILVIMASLEINIISFGASINACLDYLGSRSYSLYIVHFPMFTVTQELFYRLSLSYQWQLDQRFMLTYSAVAIVLTLLVSECTYRFIEQPWIAKGRNYLSQSGKISKMKSEYDRLILTKEANYT